MLAKSLVCVSRISVCRRICRWIPYNSIGAHTNAGNRADHPGGQPEASVAKGEREHRYRRRNCQTTLAHGLPPSADATT